MSNDLYGPFPIISERPICDNTLADELIDRKRRVALKRDNRTRDRRKRQKRTDRIKRDHERDMGPYVPHATFVTELP